MPGNDHRPALELFLGPSHSEQSTRRVGGFCNDVYEHRDTNRDGDNIERNNHRGDERNGNESKQWWGINRRMDMDGDSSRGKLHSDSGHHGSE